VTRSSSCDIAIVGGGLAGGLIALALTARHPEARVLLLESGPMLGGNHIWSFFDADIDPSARWLVEPLVTHRWTTGHMVRFPGYERTLTGAYNSITSDRFDRHLRRSMTGAAQIITGCAVVALSPGAVTLADGTNIVASAVIDARGGGDLSALRCGWQKFLGQEVRLATPHGLLHPVIMDATVDQSDGYRFVYLLPTGEDRLFVEDTYYSTSDDLPAALLRERIAAYAARKGWRIAAVEREETGVLPVLTGGDFDRFWPTGDPVARAGARAGLFHPTTGYSLPDAVRAAAAIADAWPMDGTALARLTRERATRHWRAGGYYRLLDRMLFHAAAPAERFRVFARFYRLSEPLIGRFYAGRSTLLDRMRILCGKPPVPIRSAMRALTDRSAR
jgi:lycopene beta-cyclase